MLDVCVGLALPPAVFDKFRMRFSALGDSAIVAQCGDVISQETLQRVRNFATAVERASLPGVTDVVPSFTTITIFYEPPKVAVPVELPYEHLRRELEAIAAASASAASGEIESAGVEVVVPVCYGGEYGLDIAAVAERAKLSENDVINLHASGDYLVHAIGFSPGFPYLGGLPAKLHTPRHSTPRTVVPAGSVGIGGAQTGIYPIATPGGWQLIGRTPLRLFDPTKKQPALLRLGDRVRFHPIAHAEFSALSSPAEETKLAESSQASAGIRVLRAGMLTTVQDLGRKGHRAAGVPIGGAADTDAARIANWLVGNHENATVLEFTLVGPELEFLTDALIAVGGADFGACPRWQPIAVTAGTRLNFGAARSGCRGYCAIAGGFQVDPVLGSASTFLRGGFGGHGGRALRDGDTLPVRRATRETKGQWRIDERILPAYSASPTLRVVRGAQAGKAFDELVPREFTVTPRADRMGLRLSSEPLHSDAASLLSTAVAPGTIQLPPDGQPIVLMADAQTIGGYPQVGHVIGVDMPLAAQLRPGDRVHFSEITLEQAQKLFLARERALGILHEGLVQKFA